MFFFCDFCWNGFSLQMRCFQLSLLCIFWRKQARLVSLSGDENIVRILRGRRPFFPTECQLFPSCYRSSNKRQCCLKGHLGLNWIRAEPVKPRRCLEAELCFAVTLTDSWAEERKCRPSKLLWVNGESLWAWKEIWKHTSSKAAGLIQGPNVEKHLYTFLFCLFRMRVFVIICLCAFGCECFFFLVLWSATVIVEMPPYIMVLKWPNQTGSNYNHPSWNSCFSEPPRKGKQLEQWDV